MNEDTLGLIFVLAIGAFVLYQAWQKWRAGDSGFEKARDFGELGFGNLELVKDDHGRMRVAICFSVNDEVDAYALLTSKQAFQVARMLRIAASPGPNLAMARLAHARARKAAAGTIVP